MMQELTAWLDAHKIVWKKVDDEVVDIPGMGRMFLADLSEADSVFRSDGAELRFNLPEDPAVLLDEGIRYVAFPFGRNWYWYDLREELRFNILKDVGQARPCRHDVPFVNLGVHTPYELLNAVGSIPTWCRKARWLGHTALGICDRNTLAGTLALQKECARQGLRPIFGYSLDCRDGAEEVHLKIYALTQQGLGSLLRIQKAVMVDAEDHRPDFGEVLRHVAGCAVVVGTLSAPWLVRYSESVHRLREACCDLYYQVDAAEYRAERLDREALEALRTFFEAYAAKRTAGVEPILISDCYYPDPEDARLKELVEKIASGAAHRRSDDRYFKDVDEHYRTLRPLFGERWDFEALFARMCSHTVEIARRAEAAFETGRMHMPRYEMRPEERRTYGGRRSMLRALLEEGLHEKAPAAGRDSYRRRLDEELYIVESTDNVDYFLIQWDMVREARRRGIATGIGRGSAGGSLIAFLLGITSLDPLRYGLLFSRFLVPERCGLEWCDTLSVLAPDIALDAGARAVEISSRGHCYLFAPSARLRIRRDGLEMTLRAEELTRGDEVLFDRRDILWNLKEIERNG